MQLVLPGAVTCSPPPDVTSRLNTRMRLNLPCSSKAAGLASPFYFKRAVDALSSGGGTATVASAAAAALVLTGLCRAVSGIAKEMQGPVFAPVAQVGG